MLPFLLLRAAAASPLGDYLSAPCGDLPRYRGDVDLAPLPAGEAHDGTRELSVGLGPVAELHADGSAMAPAEATRFAIAADAPAAEVRGWLEGLARDLTALDDTWLLFEAEAPARPPAPLAAEDRARYDALSEGLRSGTIDPTTLDRLALGWCAPDLKGGSRTWRGAACTSAAAFVEGVLTRRSCKADPVAALAWWDHLVDPGPGRPVALVKVKGVRQDPVPSEGTWGEVAAGFLAGNPGLRPYGPEDVRWLESGGSTASRRVQPEFPIRLRHLGPQRCLAKVSIDPTGTPTQVEVVGCHRGFVYETIRAVSEWRWDVPEADPAPPSWVTTVAVVFHHD